MTTDLLYLQKLCVTTVWRMSAPSRNHTWRRRIDGLISHQRWIGLSEGPTTAHFKWPPLINHQKYSYASPETSLKSFILCYSLLILVWYSTSLSCSLHGHFITFSLVVSCRLLSHCHLVFMHTSPENWILFLCFSDFTVVLISWL